MVFERSLFIRCLTRHHLPPPPPPLKIHWCVLHCPSGLTSSLLNRRRAFRKCSNTLTDLNDRFCSACGLRCMLQYQTRCWACRVSVAVCGGVCGRNSGLQEGSRNNHTTWEDGGQSHCSSHSLCVLEPWIMGSREHRRWGGLRGMPLGELNHKTKWCPSPTPSSQQGVLTSLLEKDNCSIEYFTESESVEYLSNFTTRRVYDVTHSLSLSGS